MITNRAFKWLKSGLIALMVMGGLPMMNSAHCGQLFTMDAARYRQRGGLVYLEIYFMVQRDQLQFTKVANGFEAAFQISVEILAQDSLVASSSWEVGDQVLRMEDITPRQKLPDIAVFNLFPGKYKIKGDVTDLKQSVTYSRALDLSLKAFPEDELSMSDIVLATKLQKDDQESKFQKNGFLVIPNPEHIYGASLPMLYYYTELYNLHPGEGEFLIERELLDDNQRIVQNLPKKRRAKIGESVVEVDGLSVASLKSGTYFLKFYVQDQDTKGEISNQIKFFIYNPTDFTSEQVVTIPERISHYEMEVQKYSEEKIEDEISELKYLLSESEFRSTGKLNSEGKKNFLVRFWRERDPNPATEANEFRLLFAERMELANQKYGTLGHTGWKTDRGRIYILYGDPTNIEYHPHDQTMPSYEIWYYDNIEGGVQFVFLDRKNIEDYRLVHSTKSGELFRPNWMELESTVIKQQY